MKPKILVVLRHSLCEEAVRILEEVGDVSVVPRFIGEHELAELVRDCSGVVLGGNRFGREAIMMAKGLKVISRHGVGVDNVDLEAATERGIVVTYTPGANADSVAEHTFALLLGLVRRVSLADRSIRDGGWGSSEFMGFELIGKTLGIIGLGAIGSRVAKRGRAFEMNIMVYDPYVDQGSASALGAKLVDLETLLRGSDVVSLHASLTKETRHILTARELGMMRRTAILINAARGQLVDEEALIQALKEGVISGAGLDAFQQEPLPADHPLLKLHNVLLTPHVAAFTQEALARGDKMVAMDMTAVLMGRKPVHIANPKVLNRTLSTSM
jgi:D-3-phosphoglycerate dehydrogenase